jgi:hypothetical protein
MRRVVCTALGVVFAAGWVLAQAGGPSYVPYRNAVVSYQRSDFVGAVRAIGSWSADDLQRIVRFALGQVGRDGGASAGLAGEPIGGATPEAAAMLHTEIVLRGQATRAVPASVHLDLAEELVRGMDRVRPRTMLVDQQELIAFQQRWYVLVASHLLSSTLPDAAQLWLERAAALPRGDRRLTGAQAWVDLTSGIAFEMAARLLDPECRRPSCDGTNPQSQMPRRLTFAQDAYLRALERDPSLVEARLRLGRVRFLRSDRKQAELELRRALAEATTLRQRYLAHLFLGELAQVVKDYPRARSEYEAARELAPKHQAPYIAIGFVDQLSGASAGLEAVATAAARSGDDERDPWWGYQNGALDEDTLDWLSAQVKR